MLQVIEAICCFCIFLVLPFVLFWNYFTFFFFLLKNISSFGDLNSSRKIQIECQIIFTSPLRLLLFWKYFQFFCSFERCFVIWRLKRSSRQLQIERQSIIFTSPFRRSTFANYSRWKIHFCFWQNLSLIHIWRCRRYSLCRSRWSPYH